MIAAAPSPPPRGLALLLGWRRTLVTLVIAGLMGLLISLSYASTPAVVVAGREMLMGLTALLAFGLFEQWPARLPSWVARWALQVLGVACAMPLSVLALYLATTPAGDPPFWRDQLRLNGFMMMTMSGLLIGPWVAVAALFRKSEYAMRRQAMSFELERSQLER